MGFQVDENEIENRLGFHPATAESKDKHQAIRRAFIILGKIVLDEVPEGREKSLALTALQEAAMWSNAGIACNLAPLDRTELTDLD